MSIWLLDQRRANALKAKFTETQKVAMMRAMFSTPDKNIYFLFLLNYCFFVLLNLVLLISVKSGRNIDQRSQMEQAA